MVAALHVVGSVADRVHLIREWAAHLFRERVHPPERTGAPTGAPRRPSAGPASAPAHSWRVAMLIGPAGEAASHLRRLATEQAAARRRVTPPDGVQRVRYSPTAATAVSASAALTPAGCPGHWARGPSQVPAWVLALLTAVGSWARQMPRPKVAA
jgi:hypothetical protein